MQVRTRSVSRQRAVLLRPMLDRLAEPEVDLRARASQSMRGKERLHLGAVRAGGRTAREAAALERRDGAREPHGFAQVVRLNPADREARVVEVAAARGIHHLLDREGGQLHEVRAVEGHRAAHTHRRARDRGVVGVVDLADRGLGVRKARELERELLAADEQVGVGEQFGYAVAEGAGVEVDDDARLLRSFRAREGALGVVAVDVEDLRTAHEVEVHLVRLQFGEALARPGAGAVPGLLLDPEVGDRAGGAGADLHRGGVDALALEVLEDHAPIGVVADRADVGGGEAEGRRAGGRVRRGSAAEDGVLEHLHLGVHGDERQHREVVVRAVAQSNEVGFHGDSFPGWWGSAVVGEALLDALHRPGDHVVEDVVEDARRDERGHGRMRARKLLREREHLRYRDRERERRVLHEGDDLVADGGDDALHHLRQDDAEECAPAPQAERLCGLPLPDLDGEDAAPVDLREIRRVVQREREDRREEARVVRERHAEEVVGREVDEEDLEHQRRAAHDADIEAEGRGDGPRGGHAPPRDDEPQRQGQQQGEREDLHRDQEPGEQFQNHARDGHTRACRSVPTTSG